MANLIQPDYRFCPRAGRSVCIRYSEGQCRDINDCAAIDCPVYVRRGDATYAVKLRNLGSALGLSREI